MYLELANQSTHKIPDEEIFHEKFLSLFAAAIAMFHYSVPVRSGGAKGGMGNSLTLPKM